MSSNKDFLPSSSPISSTCAIEIEAILGLFLSWWTITSLHSKNVLQLPYWKSIERGTSRHIVYFSYKKKGAFRLPRSGCLGTPLTLPQSLTDWRTDGWTDGWTYADVRTKIFRINGLPNLLTHGAPRARLLTDAKIIFMLIFDGCSKMEAIESDLILSSSAIMLCYRSQKGDC